MRRESTFLHIVRNDARCVQGPPSIGGPPVVPRVVEVGAAKAAPSMMIVATTAALVGPGDPALEAAVADNHDHRRDDHGDDKSEAHAHRWRMHFENVKAAAFIGYHPLVLQIGLLLVRLRAAVFRPHCQS